MAVQDHISFSQQSHHSHRKKMSTPFSFWTPPYSIRDQITDADSGSVLTLVSSCDALPTGRSAQTSGSQGPQGPRIIHLIWDHFNCKLKLFVFIQLTTSMFPCGLIRPYLNSGLYADGSDWPLQRSVDYEIYITNACSYWGCLFPSQLQTLLNPLRVIFELHEKIRQWQWQVSYQGSPQKLKIKHDNTVKNTESYKVYSNRANSSINAEQVIILIFCHT